MVDPTKLWKSAARIYGDKMQSWWGGIDPISEDRIRVLEDGDEIDLGGRKLIAVQTPGHAYHHHAYLDSGSGTVFTGDAIGVRLRDVDEIRPATPPPEFHLEKAVASIERIRSLGATSFRPTHFGSIDGDLDAVCDEGIAALRRWGEWVQTARKETSELDDAAKIVEREARADLAKRIGEDAIERLEHTTSFWMNTWGYMRDFDKQKEAAAG